MENEISTLKISMAELRKDLSFIKGSLTDNKSEHKEILSKIDHLSDTFQTRIGDKADQKEIAELLDAKYVTKEAFGNVQKIVYGLAGAILLAFLYAIIEGVINK